MTSSDQCSAIAPSQSALRSRNTGGGQTSVPRAAGPGTVFLNSDRNSRPSRASRPATPSRVDGLSTRLGAIQASDRCCPVVVGMRNGSGVLAQTQTLHAMPAAKVAAAA